MLLTILILISSLLCYTVTFNEKCQDIPCTCCNDGRCTLKADNQYICRSCIDGYTGRNCEEPCPENCVNCSQTFYTLERICFTCQNGYYNGQYKDITEYPIQNDCSLSCTTGCESCTSYTRCNRCEKGYFPRSETQCVECLTNCAKCSNLTICEQCKDRYFVENHNCRQCQQHCRTCISSQQCSVCELGYYLDGNGCKECQKEGCLGCISLNTCISCQKGYHIINGSCLRCGLDVACRNGCLAGHWGPTCEHNCSSNCSDKTCDRVSGLCVFQGKEDSEETSSTPVGLIVVVVVPILVVITVCVVSYVFRTRLTRRKADWTTRKEDKKDQIYEDLEVTTVAETISLIQSYENETAAKIKPSPKNIAELLSEPKSQNNQPDRTPDIEIEENQSEKEAEPFVFANDKIELANLEHEQRESIPREPVGITPEESTQRKTIEKETVDKSRDVKVSFAKMSLVKYFQIKSNTEDKVEHCESQVGTEDHLTEDYQNKTNTEGLAENVLKTYTLIYKADNKEDQHTEENKITLNTEDNGKPHPKHDSKLDEADTTSDDKTKENEENTINYGYGEKSADEVKLCDDKSKETNESTAGDCKNELQNQKSEESSKEEACEDYNEEDSSQALESVLSDDSDSFCDALQKKRETE